MDLEVKVHAFEPVPEIYDGHISVYPDQTLILPSRRPPARTTRASCPSREVPSRALTLDSYVAEHNIENLGLFKVDAEASDHTVLEGAKRILDRDRPYIVCEVLYTDTEHLI